MVSWFLNACVLCVQTPTYQHNVPAQEENILACDEAEFMTNLAHILSRDKNRKGCESI